MKINSIELIKIGAMSNLPQADAACVKQAIDYLDFSYAPYSNFKVGASTMLSDHSLFGGANQENASYPLCICAERSSLYHMAMSRLVFDIHCIAITAKHESKKLSMPAMPCGACRQVILEYETRNGSDIILYLINDDHEIYKLNSIKDILPFSFGSDVLL
jgi:cytidine deaminase